MPAPAAELRLTARDETQAAFNSALAGLQRLEGGVGRLKSLFSGALGGLGLGLGLEQIFRATMEAERAQLRLESVLRTTGHAAGLTAKDINQLAESLKAASTFDDDEIKAGLVQLLRFRDIGGETFRETSKLAVDFAAAMNTDVAGAMQTVGKALLAPGEGMRALKDAGVQLSDSQIELAKSLSETGRSAEAQKIVIEALRGSVGGAAQAEAHGLYGATKDLTRAWDDLVKTIGRTETAPAIFGLKALTTGVGRLNEEVERLTRGSWQERIAGLVPFVNAPLWGKPTTSSAAGNWGDTPGEEARFKAAGQAAREAERYEELLGKMDRAGAEFYETWKKDRLAKSAAAAREAATEARRIAAEAQRAKERELADDISVMERQLEAEEEFQRQSAEAWKFYTDNVIAIRAQAARDEADWFGIDLERFRDTSLGGGWGEIPAWGKPMKEEAEKVSDAARELGLTFQSAFEDAVIAGKDFSEVLQGIEKDLLRVAARRLVTEPLVSAGSEIFSGVGKWIKGLLPSAKGNVFGPEGRITAFGRGGVVDRPLLFADAAGGLNVAGEAGTEGILPLKRGADGLLGVIAHAGGGAGTVINNVTVNIDAHGAVTSSTGGNDAQMWGQVARRLEVGVKAILIQERRPGGLLAGG